jgi:hypothetical protein
MRSGAIFPIGKPPEKVTDFFALFCKRADQPHLEGNYCNAQTRVTRFKGDLCYSLPKEISLGASRSPAILSKYLFYLLTS